MRLLEQVAWLQLVLSSWHLAFSRLARTEEPWGGLGALINPKYHINVVHNCDESPAVILKSIPQPIASWNARGVSSALKNLALLQGYKADILVTCWKPSLGHLLTLVQNLEVPYYSVRWIFVIENGTTEAAMSKLFHRVGCRAVVVTATSAFVPFDTYTNCSEGVRQMAATADPAFDDRPIANLTTLRLINEIQWKHEKDWHYYRLEPQTTIIESIIQKSGAELGPNGTIQCGKFGRSNAYHLFGGAIGIIQKKQADLGTFEIFLTESIWYGVDLAGMARYDAVTFYSPLPTSITDLAIIARPFSTSLWMAVWASLSVYLMLIFAIRRSSMGSEFAPHHHVFWELADLFFYFSSVLIMHVPSHDFTRRSSTRILLGFWFIFAITMAAVFTGMLTSYTNFPPKTPPINTLRRLAKALENKKVDVCIKNNRYFRHILGCHLLEKSENLRDLFEERMASIGCQTTLCCLKKVTAGTHVFISNKQDAKLYMGHTFAGTVPAEDEFFLVHVAIVSPKMSPYTKAFYRITERLRETGISYRSQKLGKYRNLHSRVAWLYSHGQTSCACQPLQLKEIFGLLLVWGAGLFLASALLLCELGTARFWRTRRRASRRRDHPDILRVSTVKKMTMKTRDQRQQYVPILAYDQFVRAKFK